MVGQVMVRRKQGYAAAERRLTSRFQEVCSVQVNEIIGDIELSLDLVTNVGTVVATAPAEVFILNPKNCERLLQRKNTHTMDDVRQAAAVKLASRLASPGANQVPLLRQLYNTLCERLPRSDPPSRRVALSVREHEAYLATLISLFLQGRAPLIEPFVRDGLYHRARSVLRTRHMLTNPNRLLQRRKLSQAYPGLIRRTSPRSMEQLKNNPEAEQELMRVEDISKYKPPPPTEGLVVMEMKARPQSSPTAGIWNGDLRESTPSRSLRPLTAIGRVQIRECDVEFDISKTQFCTEENHLDDKMINNIFCEIESFQREKTDERLRLMSLLAVRADLGDKRDVNSLQSLLSCDDVSQECFDWETSDPSLQDLENRIANFCSKLGSTSLSRNGCLVAEMKRFEVQDPAHLPLPGGTVFVHKKACQQPSALDDSYHKHVRRFILSRETPLY